MLRLVILCSFVIAFSKTSDEVFQPVFTSRPLRILGFFPYNGYSHHIIFERLMLEMAKRGHQVTVVSPFAPTNPQPNFDHIDLSDILPAKMNVYTLEYMANAYVQSLFSVSKNLVSLSGPQLCRDVFSHGNVQPIISGQREFDVIFTEIFSTDCFLAIGHKLQIPTISISSSHSYPWIADYVGDIDNPSFLLNLFIEPSLDKLSTFGCRFWNSIAYIGSKLAYYFYISRPTELVMREYFGDNIPQLSQLRNNVSLVMVNTHESIFGAKPTVPRILPIGGIHIKPPNPQNMPADVKIWLETAPKGVVYFSLGSLMQAETLPRKMMEALLQGFENLAPLRFLWKFGAKDDKISDQLPKNVKTAEWLPQMEILSHPNTTAFFTHGGLLSMMEAVYVGVPMIGMPVYADQYINTLRACELGIAVLLDHRTITKDKVVNAITKATTDPSIRPRAREVSQLFRDRPMSPLDLAIWWTEYVVRRRGAHHLESPTARMPFWQYALLDVVAVLFIMAFVIILLPIAFVAYVLRILSRVYTKKQTDKKIV